jgi:segregation and condensation protein A
VVEREYTVRLERLFQGPMDLLLHLVREQEVEIHEIDISRILEDYLAYLGSLEALDIEVAGDFLVMAASLMAIKSRSLLPGEVVDLAKELDPREELVQRLIQYRKFRMAADALEARWRERSQQAERGGTEPEGVEPERELDLGEVTAWDLLAAFSRLMRETRADRPHHVVREPRPLRFFVDQVVVQLREEGSVSLRGLVDAFEGIPERETLIGCFCALLELVRLQVVELQAPDEADDLVVALRTENAERIDEILLASLPDDEEAEANGASQDEESAGDEASADLPPDVRARADEGLDGPGRRGL